MSYGNHGHYDNPPKRGGSGIMFLVMLFIAGFFIMNFLRQQGSVKPEGNLPGPSSGSIEEQGDYRPADYQRSQDVVESKGGIYGTGQAERPNSHPDAGDWEMEDVKSKSQRNQTTAGANSKRSEKGDWAIEEIPSASKKEQTFNLSKSAEETKPVSKSTKSGDWEFEEVDKKK